MWSTIIQFNGLFQADLKIYLKFLLFKSHLQFLNAAFDCRPLDAADGGTDGDLSESLRHGLTFPLLRV